MMSHSRFIWIIIFRDHQRILTESLLQEIRILNPRAVTGICDPNKSRARHHHSLRRGSKLKCLNTCWDCFRGKQNYRIFFHISCEK